VRQTETAIGHSTRLLDAGEELMVELGSFEFGIREVVERAQVSLRTFYQYFDARDDFFLAIYAKLVGQYAAALEQAMPKRARSTRFRFFVNAMVVPATWDQVMEEFTKEAHNRSRALMREGFYLHDSRPAGYNAAIAPLRGLLEAVLVGDEENVARDAAIVYNSLVAEAYEVTINEHIDAAARAEQLFRYHRRALGI
jgi:AcrR family transcriptional regulator